MVSQPVAHQELDSISISSFIRGYHVYKSMWTPTVGETLQLRQELQNEKDRKAVAIMKEAVVVGHVPYNLAPTISRFLQREINKGTARVTGNYVKQCTVRGCPQLFLVGAHVIQSVRFDFGKHVDNELMRQFYCC